MVTILRDDGAEIYETKGGITVTRQRRAIPYSDAVSSYVDKLDERRGAVFSSNYEYPGRYTRWDTAVVDPAARASPPSGATSGSKPIMNAARCFSGS